MTGSIFIETLFCVMLRSIYRDPEFHIKRVDTDGTADDDNDGNDGDGNNDDDGSDGYGHNDDLYIIGAVCLCVTKVIISVFKVFGRFRR